MFYIPNFSFLFKYYTKIYKVILVVQYNGKSYASKRQGLYCLFIHTYLYNKVQNYSFPLTWSFYFSWIYVRMYNKPRIRQYPRIKFSQCCKLEVNKLLARVKDTNDLNNCDICIFELIANIRRICTYVRMSQSMWRQL